MPATGNEARVAKQRKARVRMQEYQPEIVRLVEREGMGYQRAGREVGLAPNTVAKYYLAYVQAETAQRLIDDCMRRLGITGTGKDSE